MGYNWNFGVVFRDISFLLWGLRVTITISLVCLALALVIGLIAAFMRLSGIALIDRIATFYVNFFRGTPVMVFLIWLYYCVPILTGRELSALASGVIGLSLYEGSFMAEIYRGGILSLKRGQGEAALALGMTQAQAMRRIILPQAIVRMLPAIGNSVVSLIKNSSILSVLMVPELLERGNALSAHNYRASETFTVVAVLYFLVTYPLSALVTYLHRRFLPEREDA